MWFETRLAGRGGQVGGSKMQTFIRFAVAGLCFLALAIALGTLTPAQNVASGAEDSPANPWITVQVTNGQISYVLPSGMGFGLESDDDAKLLIPAILKADWKAPLSNATTDDGETPSISNENFDFDPVWTVNRFSEISADSGPVSCWQFRAACFGGMNGGLSGGTGLSTAGSAQNTLSGLVADHKGWNHGPFVPSDPDRGSVCAPFKEGCSNTTDTHRTPEPGGLAMLGMGVIALALAARRKLFALKLDSQS